MKRTVRRSGKASAGIFLDGFWPGRLPDGHRQKSFVAELMPKHPLYSSFLTPEAQAVIGERLIPTRGLHGVCWKKRDSASISMSIFSTPARRWNAICPTSTR